MEQGRKIFRAEELNEYMHSPDTISFGSKPERFDDIEINGELLSQREKSPLQQENVEHSIDFIQEHLQNLGIQSRPYDTKRIIFLPFYDECIGKWKRGDWVVIAERAETSIQTVIHELLHTISSEWLYRTSEFFESLASGRFVKTGFDVAWMECTQVIPEVVQHFKLFNEAVTEKIAREITIAHSDHAIDVAERGKDRLNYHLDEIDKITSEQMKKANEVYGKELEAIEAEHKQALHTQQLLINALMAENLSEEEFIQREKELQDQISQEGESYIYRIGRMRENFQLKAQRWRNIKEFTISMFEKPLDSRSYNRECIFLDLLLDGLGYEESKRNNLPFDEARQAVWTDLQKAYFNGQVMWLRKIERVFGKGMLRRIGELSTVSKLSTGDQFPQLIADLRSKVEEIKNTARLE